MPSIRLRRPSLAADLLKHSVEPAAVGLPGGEEMVGGEGVGCGGVQAFKGVDLVLQNLEDQPRILLRVIHMP